MGRRHLPPARPGARRGQGRRRGGEALGRSGHLEQARGVLRGALAVLEAEPDTDTVLALGKLALFEAYAGNADGDRLSTAALARAQALDLPDVTLAGLLTTRAIRHTQANLPVQAVAYLREAARRAEAGQDSASAGRALTNLSYALMDSDPAEAAAAARSAMDLSRRTGYRWFFAAAACNLMMALIATGEWQDAADVYSDATREEGSLHNPWLANGMLLLHALRGDDTEAAALLADLGPWGTSEDPQDLAQHAAATAVVANARRDFPSALTESERALAHCEALGLRNDSSRWAWTIATDAAFAVGDLGKVSDLIRWLDEHPPGHVPPMLTAQRARAGARLGSERGDPNANAAFDQAVGLLRRLGWPYLLAAGLLDQAEHLLRTGDHGSAPDALIAEAELIVRELRAGPLSEQVRRLADTKPSISVGSHGGADADINSSATQ